MLRPQHVIDWFKARSQRQQTDIHQLLDGLLIGGQVVIGGAEANVQKAVSLRGMARAGRLVSIQQARLDPSTTTTFDAGAICQLLMMAKNEAFHETATQVLNMLEQLINTHDEVDRDRAAVLQLVQRVRQQVQAVQKL